jgi:tripartite ATP-independent transporter DctM subunit
LFGGFATPVEASAITALYAFFITTFVHRDLTFTRDVPRVLVECGLLVGGVLLILGVALGFTNYLVDAFIPMRLFEFMKGMIESKLAFLLVLNLFLLLVGCMMDIFSAILVVVPLIIPLADKFNVDPVHLGVIFLANLGIGYNTPPIGLNLFIASTRFERPIVDLYRATVPFLLILLLTLALITYWPSLSLYLPKWVT